MYIPGVDCTGDEEPVVSEIIPKPLVDSSNQSLCKGGTNFDPLTFLIELARQATEEREKCTDVTILVTLKNVKDICEVFVDLFVLQKKLYVCVGESPDAQQVH